MAGGQTVIMDYKKSTPGKRVYQARDREDALIDSVYIPKAQAEQLPGVCERADEGYPVTITLEVKAGA